jgi:hypothetical protein
VSVSPGPSFSGGKSKNLTDSGNPEFESGNADGDSDGNSDGDSGNVGSETGDPEESFAASLFKTCSALFLELLFWFGSSGVSA